MPNVTTINRNKTYVYKDYTIKIRYRPKYKDFMWSSTRTIEITQSDYAPSFDAAKRAAEKWVDKITSHQVSKEKP